VEQNVVQPVASVFRYIPEDAMAQVHAEITFALNCPRLPDGGHIPHEYAQDGDNISPFLRWSDPPPGTRSFALFMEDVSAPDRPWRHWAIYDVPPGHRHIPEGHSSKMSTEALPHGTNDYGHATYDGPVPHGETAHSYRFRLFALDVETLGLGDAPMASRLMEEAKAHILGEAELTGIY
jgi:hypothetical protein